MNRKPKLGQNFLADPAAAQAIVDALGDISGHTVVEIGPGKAAITRLLASRAHRLIAIELDRELAPVLRDDFAHRANVEILERDVLQVDFSELSVASDDKLLIVGNLPYYLTSDILLHIFAFSRVISRAVIMVQREVADRVAAHAGTSDYGLLSATAQLYTRAEKLLTLPPSSFVPPPQVHSTVLRLTMEPQVESLGVNASEFIGFLRQSFAQKRKTLANNLRAAGYSAVQVKSAFEASGIAAGLRAEALPLRDAARLFLALSDPKEKAAALEECDGPV